ncbi:peptidoglycan-binding protein [Flexivirga sp. ID2601S]|uniref:Peptidoglycan-binding protein n=1 Tax=Flexivirga aerilata TaxID=1656889 RepID=A0A849AMW4_9MICO|nr:peptidoglycan-binding domain-containing protein [Flexivirga aerilata]NNG40648.1 peptidoglycan-binding protein [Flexivirga aerilata]
MKKLAVASVLAVACAIPAVTSAPAAEAAAQTASSRAQPCGYSRSHPEIQWGSPKRAVVMDLQCELNYVAHAGLVVDGIFGSRTDAAVRSFQRSRGLKVDGIVGWRTWGKLDTAFHAYVCSHYPLC